jgi:uncharacterized protein YjdB
LTLFICDGYACVHGNISATFSYVFDYSNNLIKGEVIVNSVKFAKRLLSLTIAFLLLICSVVPVMAIDKAEKSESAELHTKLENNAENGQDSGSKANPVTDTDTDPEESPVTDEETSKDESPDTTPDQEEEAYPGTSKENPGITEPLNPDGSIPDASQSEVNDSEPEDTQLDIFESTESDDTLPKSVVTNITQLEGTSSDLKLITADKYFTWLPFYDTSYSRFQFYAIISGNIPEEGALYASIWPAEEGQGSYRFSYPVSSFAQEDKESDKGSYYIYVYDFSSIMGGTYTKDIYITIWKYVDGVRVELYKSDPFSVKYSEYDYSASPRHVFAADKYVNVDDMYFSFAARVLHNVNDEIDGNEDIEIKLIDNNGKVVGRSLGELENVNASVSNEPDYRYNEVFGKNHNIMTNYRIFSARILRTAEWDTGPYGITVAINGIDIATSDNVVDIVDGVVIDNIYTDYINSGYPPVQDGSRKAYIILQAERVNKDDVRINIKDADGNIIGRSTESRYDSGNSIIYKLVLDGGESFSFNNKYFIECVSDSNKCIYINNNNIRKLNVSISRFTVYDTILKGDKAEIKVRAVNPPQEEVEVKLSRNVSGELSLIGSKSCKLEEETIIRFENSDGDILRLDNGEYVLNINYENTGFYSYFYVYSNDIEESSEVHYLHDPYFYNTSTNIPIDIMASKQAYNITDSSQFDVVLIDERGIPIGTAGSNIDVSDTVFYRPNTNEEVDAKRITGAISLNEGVVLKEAVYTLSLIINGFEVYKSKITCIDNSKIYAVSCYPSVETKDSGITIKGHVLMLKKDQPYDDNKFSYIVTDLLGNPVSVTKPAVTHSDLEYSYQDYYEINATVDNSIPAAYYTINLKYDGKNIYDLNDPSRVFVSGYNSIFSVPARPEIFSWYGNQYDGIYGAELNGRTKESDIVELLVYDSDNKLVFDPIRSITLTKHNDINNMYVIRNEDLAGLDPDQKYRVCMLINDEFISGIETVLAAIDEEIIPVADISLDKSTLDVKVNETKQLKATVTPSNATDKKITWTSSNDAVAKVDTSGNVTGVAPGTAVITAKAGAKTAECTVTVTSDSSGGNSGGGGTGGNNPDGGGAGVTPGIGTGTPAADPVNPEVKADSSGKAVIRKDMLAKAETLTVKAEVEIIFDKIAAEFLKSRNVDEEIKIARADASSLSAEAKELIGNRSAYGINITAGGKPVTDLGGGTATVRIPYALGDGEDPNAVVACSVDANEKESIICLAVYDPETKSIIFKTNHFSVYAVGYNKKEFSDVPAWASEYVTFLAARE